jgi:hypothetical protein
MIYITYKQLEFMQKQETYLEKFSAFKYELCNEIIVLITDLTLTLRVKIRFARFAHLNLNL